MYCNPPSSSVHGISQARMLEWVAISFSRGSSRPRDGTYVSHIDKQVLYFLSHQENPFRRNRRHKMLPVKVENKYKDLIYEQEETNRRKSLRKRNLLYMLHIKHIQLLLYFIYIWYWIGSLYSNFFFSSWDIQTVRCSMSYIYHSFMFLDKRYFPLLCFQTSRRCHWNWNVDGSRNPCLLHHFRGHWIYWILFSLNDFNPLQYSCWQIPWMEEPGRLQSMGLLGVGHDWVTSLSLFTFMHWRRKWQPTPVFLPGESQVRMSLVGCCLWGRTESDTTEATWWWWRRWLCHALRQVITVKPRVIIRSKKGLLIGQGARPCCEEKFQFQKTWN